MNTVRLSKDVKLTDDIMYGDVRGLAFLGGAIIGLPILALTDNASSFREFVQKGELDIRKLALGKRGDNPDETFAIQAMMLRLPVFKTNEEFVRLTKEGQAEDTDPQRFKTIKHEVTAYPKKDTDCVKSYMVAEDHAPAKRSGKSGHMILEALTLICAHPENKNVGVSVTYSQRYYPEQSDPAFFEKAARVLDSVEFTGL